MAEARDDLPGVVIAVETQGNTLSGISLFNGFDANELKQIERSCVWRKCRSGDQILTRYSLSRDIIFVVSGEVRIVNFSLTGREVAYAEVKSGGYFGELAAIDGEPRSANVVAHQDCLLASLSPPAFRDVLRSHPEVGVRVLEKLARIVRVCDDRIMDLATLGAHQRVYRELSRLITGDPIRLGSWLIYPSPTQATIAAKASTTRETVARVMSQLTSAGILERKSKTLYVRDRERLNLLIEHVSPMDDAAR
ncbi:MAG: Crp/Fnr family transcriptional regulator [Alphaproteobacteria bacterium]|nr:Crp/Fnr family transcriptional regulator [Alphaproteobacteria bacterium]